MSAAPKLSVFTAYSPLPDSLSRAESAIFAARVCALARGTQKCLQIIEVSEADRQENRDNEPDPLETLPLLGVYDTSVLFLLAVTITEIISEQADEFLTRIEGAPSSRTNAGGTHE